MSDANDKAYTDLLATIVRPLLGNPDDFTPELQRRENSVRITFSVHPEDVARIVGKGGANIGAIRCIMEAAAARRSERLSLDVNDA